MKFRDFVDENIVDPDDMDTDRKEYVTVDFVENLLDLVEGRVADIENELSSIKGLTEIDYAKENVSQLLKDLY